MTTLPGSLAANPSLDTWIRVDPADTITVFTGKVELGQGVLAAIGRIAADELDVRLDRIRVVSSSTTIGPVEPLTVGSMSMEQSGTAVRQAAADARAVVLKRAAVRLDSAAKALRIEDGTIVSPTGESTSYWEVMAEVGFGIPASGRAAPKSPETHTFVGTAGPRPDLRAVVSGTLAYVNDLADEGTLHGRVLRPPGRGARLVSVDLDRVRALPGVVAAVRDGSFLGVVAEGEEAVDRAVVTLRSAARWTEPDVLPPFDGIHDWLRSQPTQDFLVEDGVARPCERPPVEAEPSAVTTVRRVFTRPYLLHAPIGPSAALAVWDGDTLRVRSPTQGVFMLRGALADALGLLPESVHVEHVRGAGCYGHSGIDDAALDAALLARAVPGRPVLLRWSREDEHTWEPFGPAGVAEIQASLDADGNVVSWNHDIWSTTHLFRTTSGANAGPRLLALQDTVGGPPSAPPEPMTGFHAGIHRNADPLYDLPHRRIVKHFVQTMPLRTSALRSLGAWFNVLVIESMMDELAEAAGADPVEFRLRRLGDPRARAVIEAAAERAGWGSMLEEGRGRGLGFARYKNVAAYAAVVIELTVDDATAAIRLDRAVIAADAGEIVDPNGLANQLEGGLVQSASWTLKERVTFDERRITSVDWDTYPILRFDEVPEIETVLLDRPGEPYLGAGEATQGPTAAAIANAVYAAVGLRLTDTPFTPERVLTAALR